MDVKTVIILSALSFLSSCATLVKIPVRQVSRAQAEKSWQAVLTHFVDEDGWVDFEGLKKNPEDLNNFVSFISQSGPKNAPQLFTTPGDKLAFYLNSYNALSMYNIIDSGIPESHSGLKKVKFFIFKKMPIGGEVMSLKTYEDDTIRKLGEPRVHFALNCMAASCPQLPRVAFNGAHIEDQLQAGAKKFFSEKRNLSIDRENKVAHTTEILSFFPHDFLAKAPTLIDFINQYSSEKIPADYKLKYFDYDWTVINQAKKAQYFQNKKTP
jgi:hypothetical protein